MCCPNTSLQGSQVRGRPYLPTLQLMSAAGAGPQLSRPASSHPAHHLLHNPREDPYHRQHSRIKCGKGFLLLLCLGHPIKQPQIAAVYRKCNMLDNHQRCNCGITCGRVRITCSPVLSAHHIGQAALLFAASNLQQHSSAAHSDMQLHPWAVPMRLQPLHLPFCLPKSLKLR